MNRFRYYSLVSAFLLISNFTKADEGMWLLSLLEGYTIEDMQSKGFKLTAENKDDLWSSQVTFRCNGRN